MEYILLCLSLRKTFNFLYLGFCTFSNAIGTHKTSNDVRKSQKIDQGVFYVTGL